jgi:glycosyltransferase involved in cell wall biosynthesis
VTAVARRRLRIALVYDALYPELKGGAERRFHEIGTRLAKRHDVHQISWRYWPERGDTIRDARHMHGVGMAPHFYGSDGKRTVGEALSFAARSVPELLRRRYDVIDCSATPYLPVYSARLISLLTRTPLVVTWHELWGDHWRSYLPDRPIVARLGRMAEAGAARLGGVRVAVSPFTAARLQAAGVASSSIRVVGNGVSISALSDASAVPWRPDVVFVGRLIEDKRVDLLLEAIHHLCREFPSISCLVVGEGPERAALEARCAALGLAGNVEFVGHLADRDVRGAMKAAKTLVLPSIREGFGIVAIEAQAAGAVPLVVRSPHSAAASLIRDGVDGIVCEPNAESIAGGLRSLLGSPGRLADMKRVAMQAARAWDWDDLSTAMEQVYLEAAAAEPAPKPRWKLSWR